MDQPRFYELMYEVDLFDLVRLGEQPDPEQGDLALYQGDDIVGAFARAHDVDEALSARALLDNLACKASGAYWCADCQDIHRLPGTCPQQRLPLDGAEATNG
jgi:hypothetical protein